MLTYHQLDIIADLYIPVLSIVSAFFLANYISKYGIKKIAPEIISIIAAIFMLLDNKFNVWPAFGLDYSTHTALSLVFVVYLSVKNTTLAVLSVLSFLLYVLLMRYQKYHTIADIVSTSVVLLPIFWMLLHKKTLKKTANKISESAL